MANRLNAPNTFATLSPPWVLSQLDTNATQNQAAWNDSSLGFVNGICTDTGSANAYVVSAVNLPFGAPSSYQSGMTVFLIPANSNTTASTITVGALGSAAILTPAGNALLGGEINANQMLGLIYNAAVPTGFRILGPCQLTTDNGSLTANTSVNLAGYTSGIINAGYTSTGTFTITFNNVSQGIPLVIRLANNSAGSVTFKFAGTTANGSAITTATGANGGVDVDMLITGLTTSAGGRRVFTGGVTSAATMRFGYM